MSTGTTKNPNLLAAPTEYSQQYQEQMNAALRLYFNQLDNPGPSAMATQRNVVNGEPKIIAALNFSQANTTSGARVVSLPTQDDYVYLRVGDVYLDTANANVLKVKV